jgi:glycosyltransferase involved in cell wall biosynthesis
VGVNNLVSIVTVVYNNASTIRDAIESVLSQDYPNIQYIIIDGGSTDGTLQIIEEYRSRIHTVISEKDKGIFNAMNKGLGLCQGEWSAILNSDDVYAASDVISKVNAEFDKTSCDAVYGDLVYVAPDNLNKVIRYWKSGKYHRNNFLYGWMPAHPSFFIRTKYYRQFGVFREELIISADYELMVRMLYKHKLTASWIPKVLVKMRTGGNSDGDLSRRIRANQEDKTSWTVNDLSPYWFTLFLKPLRKIGQFIPRRNIQ